MYKLLSFLVFLAVAFAAPAPEPGAAYAPIAYNAYVPSLPIGYALPPSAAIPYNPVLTYHSNTLPGYPAPIAYKLTY